MFIGILGSRFVKEKEGASKRDHASATYTINLKRKLSSDKSKKKGATEKSGFKEINPNSGQYATVDKNSATGES